MNERSGLDFASVIAGLPVPIAKFGDSPSSASTTPNIAPARLGKSTEGDPAILFPSSERATQRPPIELRHLSVLFGARCHVSGEVEEEAYFTVVRCHGDDALKMYFLLMAGTLLSASGPGAQRKQLSRSQSSPLSNSSGQLAGRQPTRCEVDGENCSSLRKAPMRSLRYTPGMSRLTSGFYFGAGPQRVEVKTSGRGSRRHHFSLEGTHSSWPRSVRGVDPDRALGGGADTTRARRRDHSAADPDRRHDPAYNYRWARTRD